MIDSETTMRIMKKDAMVLKQMQNMLEMQGRNVTQAEIMHQMLDFLTSYQSEFFKEFEERRKENEKIMEEWTKFMLKRMQSM